MDEQVEFMGDATLLLAESLTDCTLKKAPAGWRGFVIPRSDAAKKSTEMDARPVGKFTSRQPLPSSGLRR